MQWYYFGNVKRKYSTRGKVKWGVNSECDERYNEAIINMDRIISFLFARLTHNV